MPLFRFSRPVRRAGNDFITPCEYIPPRQTSFIPMHRDYPRQSRGLCTVWLPHRSVVIGLFAVIFMIFLGGCAMPYYVNQPLSRLSAAKIDPSLAGVWSITMKKGVHWTLTVYPLNKHSYLVQNVEFSARHQQISSGIMRVWMTTLGTQHYLTCEIFTPQLINQPDNIAALKQQLAAADNNSERLFTQSLIESCQRTGVARVYFIVRIDSLTPTRLTVTPYMLSPNGNTPHGVILIGRWFKSTAALADYIQGVAGPTHAAKKPWVFERIKSGAALPDGFYMAY